jgi:hypothetical protein
MSATTTAMISVLRRQESMLLLMVCINTRKIHSMSTKDLISHKKMGYITIHKHEKHALLTILTNHN